MVIEKVVVVYGGELASDVAQQVVAKKPPNLSTIEVSLRNASERPKTLLDIGADTVVCFVMQTIENGSPTEDVSCDCWNVMKIRIFQKIPKNC